MQHSSSFTNATAAERETAVRRATAARATEWSQLGDVVLQPHPSSGADARTESDTDSTPLHERTSAILRQNTGIVADAALSDDAIRRIFDDMDRDNDGSLDRAELRKVLLGGETARPEADEEVGRVLQELDADGDGSLSFDEFRDLIRTQHARRAALYIEDGLSARSSHRLGTRNLKLHRIYMSQSWQNFVIGACLVHMAMALFEHPARLHAAPANVTRVGVLDALELDHPWLRYVLLALEACCCAVYLGDVFIYGQFRPRECSNGRLGLWLLPTLTVDRCCEQGMPATNAAP